jgi:hypothetical protein
MTSRLVREEVETFVVMDDEKGFEISRSYKRLNVTSMILFRAGLTSPNPVREFGSF